MVSSSYSSSTSGAISFGGVASGLDTNGIISKLMALKQRPIDAVQRRVDTVQTKINAYGSLNTALGSLMTATAPLKDPKTFSQRSASVSALTADAGKVSASVANGAALQTFQFQGVALATATTATSTAAMGSPVDANVPLDEAGFGTAVEAGTFSINGHAFTIDAATPSTYESGASIGASFSATDDLADATLDVPITSGSFVINGQTINFNANNDTLTEVMSRINAADAGVTASFDNTTKRLTLTATETGPAAITISDSGGGTFFQSMKMLDGGGGNVGTITAGTDMVSLNDLITEINGAGIGVTASIVNDAAARPNVLQLVGATSVQVGSGGDTSNFLSATGLLQSPSGTTRTGVNMLGQSQQSLDLDSARLATALTTSTGSFNVNGVEITWDATSDSLQNIITRINASSAKVTATYDASTDKMLLTADDMGSTAISLEDVTGNFLASAGLLAATQSLGSNASYQVNGGPVRYSTSNTIRDVVPGVTITMTDITDSPVTVGVNLGTQAVSTAVSSFVTAYNNTLAGIRSLTAYDSSGRNNGILFGDNTVARLESQLRTALTGFISDVPGGLRSLADIGLSFGAVGSAVGTTETLVLDAAKLNTALQTNADAVGALLTTFTASAALDAGGTGSVASISGTPTNATKAGRYSITSDVAGNVEVSFQGTDGSAPLISSGTLTAGGTNTTLIPGVTITAKGSLVAGTDTITLLGSPQGFGKTIYEYLNSLTTTGGLLSNRTDEMQTQITSMNAQIDRMSASLEGQQAQLQAKFAAMEQTIARLQSQQQQFSSTMAKVTGK